MIGKLKGMLDCIGNGEIIVDVGGVGYLLSVGARMLRGLDVGQAIEVHVETYVRQDVFKLFGFASEEERAWFIRLQDVQGVGAKSALAVLDVLSPAELMQASLMEDKAAVARANGVGPKVAARIVAELKDKPAPAGRGGAFAVQSAAIPATQAGPGAALAPDAVSALLNLGFAAADASAAVRMAAGKAPADASLDTLIRLALQELNR